MEIYKRSKKMNSKVLMICENLFLPVIMLIVKKKQNKALRQSFVRQQAFNKL